MLASFNLTMLELASSNLTEPELAGSDFARPELASSDLARPKLASFNLAKPELASSSLAKPEPPDFLDQKRMQQQRVIELDLDLMVEHFGSRQGEQEVSLLVNCLDLQRQLRVNSN